MRLQEFHNTPEAEKEGRHNGKTLEQKKVEKVEECCIRRLRRKKKGASAMESKNAQPAFPGDIPGCTTPNLSGQGAPP